MIATVPVLREDVARSSATAPTRTRWARALLTALALGAAGSGTAAPARAADTAPAAEPPRCFGAASRDPLTGCVNPALRLAVQPTPDNALLAPNSPCQPTPNNTAPFRCVFGIPAAEATNAPIALIGDSHATHWRAALEPVARQAGRVGTSMARTGCAYSKLITALDGADRGKCIRWVRHVRRWLTRHPKVSTVFISTRSSLRSEVPPGKSMFEAQVAAYQRAWADLPATVKRVVIIRDVPTNNARSNACIEDARRKRKRAGIVCALPRNRILHRDPAAVAARRLKSPRVVVVDLTDFMCSARLCFPVIGGVLVHKDIDHMTAAFAATLAPYLHRRLRQLLPEWP